MQEYTYAPILMLLKLSLNLNLFVNKNLISHKFILFVILRIR